MLNLHPALITWRCGVLPRSIWVLRQLTRTPVGQRAQADELVQAQLYARGEEAGGCIFLHCFAGVSDATRAPDGKLSVSFFI